MTHEAARRAAAEKVLHRLGGTVMPHEAGVNAILAFAVEAAQVERVVVDAVLYAMKCGCFHPVPEPPKGSDVDTLVKWGAMRNLHSAVAALREELR